MFLIGRARRLYYGCRTSHSIRTCLWIIRRSFDSLTSIARWVYWHLTAPNPSLKFIQNSWPSILVLIFSIVLSISMVTPLQQFYYHRLLEEGRPWGHCLSDGFKRQVLVPCGVERVFALSVPLAGQATHALDKHELRKFCSHDTRDARGKWGTSMCPLIVWRTLSPLTPILNLRYVQGDRNVTLFLRASLLRPDCESKIAGCTQKIMFMPVLFCGPLRVVCGLKKILQVCLACALRFGQFLPVNST
jgi:hypothetical protein